MGVTEETFSSQERQSAASSAEQKRIAAALSQESQRVRIICSQFHPCPTTSFKAATSNREAAKKRSKSIAHLICFPSILFKVLPNSRVDGNGRNDMSMGDKGKVGVWGD